MARRAASTRVTTVRVVVITPSRLRILGVMISRPHSAVIDYLHALIMNETLLPPTTGYVNIDRYALIIHHRRDNGNMARSMRKTFEHAI